MHDFCFTPIYSTVLFLGALIAFFSKGSTASMIAGGSAALITGLCSYVSMQIYLKHHKKCVPAVVTSLAVAAGVTAKMANSFLSNPKTHILQGVIAAASLTMVVYYLWNLTMFKVGKPAKKPVKRAA